MKPKSSPHSSQEDLFRMRLENLINPAHELVQLAELINWEEIEIHLSRYLKDSNRGAPGLPSRLVAGMLYLQHAYGLSDEGVLSMWLENPYYQYFCGEEYFQHELPFDDSSLSRWRKRMGKSGCEKLLQMTIMAAQESQLLKHRDMKKLIVDTTVQEKNIRFPTDSGLLERVREHLVKLCQEHGIQLRQNYNREAPRLAIQVSRYAHAKQFKRMNKTLKLLKTRVGRVVRDIERQLSTQVVPIQEAFAHKLGQAKQLLAQTRTSKNKLYSLHEPDTECISKGKAHKRYEFGVKASFAVTHKQGLVIGALSCPGNPYDGHTLASQLEQVEGLTGIQPKQCFVDKGYRGNKIKSGTTIYVSGQKRGVKTRHMKAALKRRSAIEPEIGHMKKQGKLGRNYLSGLLGDEMNAILSGAGHNIRKLLAWLKLFGVCILLINSTPRSENCRDQLAYAS